MIEETIFARALEKTSQAERAAFLEQACAGDKALRRRVEALLESHEELEFLRTPAVEHAAIALGAVATLGMPTTAAADDRASAEQPGTVIGPYKLLQIIGEGGMGTVFMAEQTEPVRRTVALKLIKAGMDSRQVLARFGAERQALALMDHPNIARVLDAGVTQTGRPYFVMELVKGVPITRFCDERRLTPRERLELFISVCQGVQHAHQKGIIHRDLNPSNVLVALYDDKPVPKIIDFGVAKATSTRLTDATLFTGFGTVVGTPKYMSPEQAELNQLDIDTRSDIYSLGVLLYELLTGSTPLQPRRLKEATLLEMLRLIREEEPPRPSTRLGTTEELPSIAANRGIEPRRLMGLVRGELDWIVMKALEKDRGRRYQTASSFAQDLQHYLAEEPVQACPPSVWYRFRKFARRNRLLLGTGLSVALAALLAMVVLAVSYVRVRRETQAKEVALKDKGDALKRARANYEEARAHEQRAAAQARRAKDQSDIAREHAKTAKAQELLARRRFYAAQMHLAMQAWEAGNPARVLALLESQRPKVDEDDLRTFEWYYLWRLCQGGLRHRFPMIHHDNASAMALSPDGHTLATGFDQSIKLWDTRTGRETLALTGHRGVVEGMAFTQDGRSLVAGDGSTVRLWDLTSGKERAIVTPGEGPACYDVAVAGDGNTLALGGATLTLWDLSQSKLLGAVASGADGPYLKPAIASDGQTVAARCGSSPYVVKIWTRDGQSWRERHSISGHGWGFSAAFSPDGNSLAVSGGQARCYDVATGQLQYALKGAADSTVAVNYSADGKLLITASGDKMARVWDAATGRQIATFAHPVGVHGAVLSADGKVAATAAGVIGVWDTTPPREAVILRHTAAVSSVAISRDGKTLATGGWDGTNVWDLGATEELRRQPTVEPYTILTLPGPRMFLRGVGLALSPDGKTLATPDGSGGGIAIWSIRGEKRTVLEGHDTLVSRMAISPDGTRLASVTDAPEAILWDLGAGKPLSKISMAGEMYAVAFSPDGKWLAAGSQFGVVKLFDAATGRETATLQRYEFASTWAHAVAFSPDSTLLAASSQEGIVQVWEVATGRLQTTMKGHLNWVLTLGFSPDGQTLATGSGDSTVKLWDVATGQERCTLKGHQGVVRALEFAPDGNTLVTAGDDGTVRLWPAAAGPDARARKKELEAGVPGTPAAHNERCDALWQYGRTDEAARACAEAEARLEKLALTFPDSPGLMQETIRSLLSQSLLLEEIGRHQDAGPLRARAHEIYRNLCPNDQQALIWAYCERGRKLATIQNNRQAERTYNQALELAPMNERAHSWRRSVYARLGEWDKVVAECSQILELKPDDADSWNRRGIAYAQLGQNEKSVADYSRAVQLKPAEPLYRINRGSGYARLGQHDQAVADFSRAIDLDPNNPFYHYRLGAALDDLGKTEEALQRYCKAIRLKPQGDVRNNLSKRLRRQRAALDERAASSPKERSERSKLATDYWRLAVALRDLNQYSQSEAACRQAQQIFLTLADEEPWNIQFDYDIGWASHLLADMFVRSGRFEEAAPLARESLTRFQTLGDARSDRPEYHDAIAVAYGLLAHLLDRLNKPEDAAQAQRAAQVAKQSAEQLRTLPSAQELLGSARPFSEKRDWKQAAAELNKGFERQPRSDAFLCYSTALARLLAGDVDGYTRLAERMPALRRGRWETLDVLRTRTIHPRGANDPAALIALAQSLCDETANNWNAYNLGMAHYRAGELDAAIRRMEQARELGDWYLFYPGLAMAHHRLGHTDEARKWLDRANDWFRRATEANSEPLKVTKEDNWQDWAYFEVLLREANTLVGGDTRP